MPPEALEEIPRYSASIDVFSFGHLSLYTIIQVFPIPISSTFMDPVKPGVIMARSEVQRRMKFIQQLSQQLGHRHLLVQLVMQCLHNDPNQRPTANELLLQLEQVRAGINDPYADMSRLEMMQALRERDARIEELEAMVEREGSVAEEDEDTDTDTGSLHNWLMQLRVRLIIHCRLELYRVACIIVCDVCSIGPATKGRGSNPTIGGTLRLCVCVCVVIWEM